MLGLWEFKLKMFSAFLDAHWASLEATTVSPLVGRLVDYTFRFPLCRCLVDHGTWYIFWKLWSGPTYIPNYLPTHSLKNWEQRSDYFTSVFLLIEVKLGLWESIKNVQQQLLYQTDKTDILSRLYCSPFIHHHRHNWPRIFSTIISGWCWWWWLWC